LFVGCLLHPDCKFIEGKDLSTLFIAEAPTARIVATSLYEVDVEGEK